MTGNFELIGVRTQNGPGPTYLIENEVGEIVGSAEHMKVGGTYAAVSGEMEIECSEWRVEDNRLYIEP